MDDLRTIILDALEAIGCNVLAALEYWYKFSIELHQLPEGHYTYTVGKTEISFTIQ